MITDTTQLGVALHQLTSLEDMLEAMRRHLSETNPEFFPVVSESYLQRIRELQAEVLEYLREGPEDALTPLHISGTLVAVDTEENTCRIHPEGGNPVDCGYDESLEDEIVSMLRRPVELVGQSLQLGKQAPGRRVARVERLKALA